MADDTTVSVETALIDPWPLWAIEDEDDEGNLIPDSWELYLTPVVSPVDGTEWLTSIFGARLMLRRDVVDLETKPPTGWGAEHRPQAWNALNEAPCAVPTRARFVPELVAPLVPLGVKVLPLTNNEQAKPMAHAIMRSEDLIGYVMSTVLDYPQLPEALQVPERGRRLPPDSPSAGEAR